MRHPATPQKVPSRSTLCHGKCVGGNARLVLPKVERKIEQRLADDEGEEQQEGRTEEGDREAPDEDREMEDHDAAIGRRRLGDGGGLPVLAAAEVVPEERQAVAKE